MATELDLLKQRADIMGIPYKSNIGVDTLKRKIEAHQNPPEEPEEDDEDEVVEAPKKRRLTKEEKEQQIRDEVQKRGLALVRVRIANMNPAKNDLDGEIITVANKYLGNVSKFIPFGDKSDGGYHIPRVILNDLRARKFQQVTVRKVKGKLVTKTRMVPEYMVEELPMLTPEELEKLAARQAAAAALEGSDDDE